jgi:hypothetical protein
MKKFLLTIFAVLFLVFLFLFWGGSVFTKMSINNTVSDLRDSIDFNNKELFTYSEIKNQPELIKNYFTSAIADSTIKPKFITVKQKAEFKTDVKSEWKPLTAVQYFTTDSPNFLWASEMKSSNFFWVNAIDSYINGKGNMLIKLNSSITVADSWGIELDKSGLFRYISEAVLFPTKLLPSQNLLWNILDSNTAEIKFTDGELSVVAKLFFNSKNLISKIETFDKYRALEEGYERSMYTIYLSEYKKLKGFMIPTYIEAEWDLKSGKFMYGKFSIVNIEYE